MALRFFSVLHKLAQIGIIGDYYNKNLLGWSMDYLSILVQISIINSFLSWIRITELVKIKV